MSNPISTVGKVHTILIVENLLKSKMFYQLLFDCAPIVDTENIVEYQLNNNFVLGIQTQDLPEKLFDSELLIKFKLNKPTASEIYIECEDAEQRHQKALQLGCLELSAFMKRNWGHSVGYSVNHDGHVLAFAESD